MRIVDFKELLSLPPFTLFSMVDCNAARHSAVIREAYIKQPGSSEATIFYGEKVGVLEGCELSLQQVAHAYVKNESIYPPLENRVRKFTLDPNAPTSTQFAVWEKSEIEQFMEIFKKTMTAFPPPNVVTN